ncbi:MAG: alpha/beta hydrolase, partial [Alphaproteobacteria bacterium]|nr:alpha/beta hydrolase [Alphaproteobacteria bacterium]
ADQGLAADGLILLAPAVRTRKSFGRFASAGAWFFSHTVPWLPVGPTSIDFEPTDNPKALERLAKDPLMLRNPRVDMTTGLLDLMDAGCAAAENLQMPYMLLYGMADYIVPSGPTREAIKLMPPRPDSKLAFYAKGHHLLLRDKEGPKVAEDVVAWMGNHEAALPSGADGPTVQPKMLALWGSGRAGAEATTAVKSD